MALLSALASLILLLLAPRPLRKKLRYIVVDGSNVLHRRDPLGLATVKEVVNNLKSNGFTPVVWFDANVGYKISDAYMGPYKLALALGLPERQVFVAAKGTPADPLLLQGAQDLQARVVSNDRFRDWASDFPQVQNAGTFLRGRVTDGVIALEEAA
jgi:hypothetical protein